MRGAVWYLVPARAGEGGTREAHGDQHVKGPECQSEELPPDFQVPGAQGGRSLGPRRAGCWLTGAWRGRAPDEGAPSLAAPGTRGPRVTRGCLAGAPKHAGFPGEGERDKLRSSGPGHSYLGR